jgi:hypothetical protein
MNAFKSSVPDLHPTENLRLHNGEVVRRRITSHSQQTTPVPSAPTQWWAALLQDAD